MLFCCYRRGWNKAAQTAHKIEHPQTTVCKISLFLSEIQILVSSTKMIT